MAMWCVERGAALQLEGEVGFGRPCVGVIIGGSYPSYKWYDSNYQRLDDNGQVWVPADAYHKHPCVAVLGRGDQAEKQLYEWLRWFDANGFELIETHKKAEELLYLDAVDLMLGKGHECRMVRKKD